MRSPIARRFGLALALLCLIGGQSAAAEDPAISDLLTRIEALEERVRALEHLLAKAPQTVPVPDDDEAPVPAKLSTLPKVGSILDVLRSIPPDMRALDFGTLSPEQKRLWSESIDGQKVRSWLDDHLSRTVVSVELDVLIRSQSEPVLKHGKWMVSAYLLLPRLPELGWEVEAWTGFESLRLTEEQARRFVAEPRNQVPVRIRARLAHLSYYFSRGSNSQLAGSPRGSERWWYDARLDGIEVLDFGVSLFPVASVRSVEGTYSYRAPRVGFPPGSELLLSDGIALYRASEYDGESDVGTYAVANGRVTVSFRKRGELRFFIWGSSLVEDGRGMVWCRQ